MPHKPRPTLSIVIPFHNEEECITEVVEELLAVLGDGIDGGWELLMINDGSRDRTGAIMHELIDRFPHRLRSLTLHPNSGQSAALEAGFHAARAPIIATLDGDGQNDPADIPRLLAEMRRRRVDMMCGIRARRADNWVRRASSRIANRIRSFVLGDNITDVGCSIRVFRRGAAIRIPHFRNFHRYFPALMQMRGYRVAEMPVAHRSRAHGQSKYGGGINSRLWVGIVDLAGAWWLRRRALSYRTTRHEIGGQPRVR